MISIVIPTFNEENYIGFLLESIFHQTLCGDVEIIIADAGSTDRTRSVIQRYKSQHPRLFVVKGGMPAVGRNNGAKASSGDPIFFIDADMLIPDKEFLKNAVAHFQKEHLGVATVCLEPNSDFWVDRFMTGCYNFFLPISKFFRPMGSMCIVVSRAVFDKTGGYPEDVVMAEDHDFVYRSSQCGKFGILPGRLVFSIRRLRKEGRIRLLFKYTVFTLQLLLIGPVRKPLLKYEFGNYNDKDDEEKLQNHITRLNKKS